MAKPRQSFELWMQAVNDAMVRTVGLTSDDIPDWRYADAFQEGMTPSKAAREALADAD